MLTIQEILKNKTTFKINLEEWIELFTMQRSNNYIWFTCRKLGDDHSQDMNWSYSGFICRTDEGFKVLIRDTFNNIVIVIPITDISIFLGTSSANVYFSDLGKTFVYNGKFTYGDICLTVEQFFDYFNLCNDIADQKMEKVNIQGLFDLPDSYIWLGFDTTIGEYCLYNSLGEMIETLNELLEIGDGLHTETLGTVFPNDMSLSITKDGVTISNNDDFEIMLEMKNTKENAENVFDRIHIFTKYLQNSVEFLNSIYNR